MSDPSLSRVAQLVGSAMAFMAALAMVASGTGILLWKGLVFASPLVLVSSLSIAVAIWATTPPNLFASRRGATLVALVLSCLLVFVGIKYALARPIQSAVSHVIDAGGTVTFDYEWEEPGYVKTRNGWVIPNWLRHIAGDCLFAHVDHVDLGNGTVTDENISDFDLHHFDSVEFSSSSITDQAMVAMRIQTQLSPRRACFACHRYADLSSCGA